MPAEAAPAGSPYELDVFLNIVKTLSSEKIAGIPLEKVPDNVPASAVEQVPLAARGAVENLLMAANSFHLNLHRQDLEKYGEEIVAAMDMANTPGKLANVKVFEKKIVNLVGLLQEAQKKQSLDVDLVASNVSHINGLLIDIRTDNAALLRAGKSIAGAQPANDYDGYRIKLATDRLESKAKTLGKALTEYYILRLKIIARAMLEKRKTIRAQEKHEQQLREQLAEHQVKLGKSQSLWKRATKNRAAKEEYTALQKRVGELIAELKANEVVIEEKNLTEWLDAIVDASLNERAVERLGKTVGDARASLYIMLQRYCQSQEDSAIQIAQNPFLQVDPKQAIEFVLLSEQFILGYFANKRKDPSALLSGAAQLKMDDLDQLQKDILQELRRAMKLHRKR